MGDCLVGCISSYQCGPKIDPPPWAVLAPYIKVTFGGGELTVGNHSSPANQNMAIVTGLTVGFSNGFMAKIEITDQEGGAFYNFFNNLTKCVKDTKDITLDYGWIGRDCDGNVCKKTLSTDTQGPSHVVPIKMKVEKAAGSFHYTLECVDIGAVASAAKTEDDYGDDQFNRLTLKQAIIQLCKKEPPTMNVEFIRKVPGCGEQTWDFEAINDPPKSGWKTNNQSKPQVINQWIRPYKTNKGKGILIVHDDTKPNTLVLLEDNSPECDSQGKCDSPNYGTFIVNGGNCSNVLDFSPSMDWVTAWGQKISGGEGGSPVSAQTIKNKGKLPDSDGCGDRSHVGIVGGSLIENHARENYGEEVIEETIRSQNAHQYANSIFAGSTAVEAELKVMGIIADEYTHVLKSIGGFVSIVYINPYYVSNEKDGDCPKWLAQPMCNQALSSTNWQIMEINHEITAGHFYTKLKVKLGAPGIDMNSGQLMGGDTVAVSCNEDDEE